MALAVSFPLLLSSCDRSADDAAEVHVPVESESQLEPEEPAKPQAPKRVVAPVGVCAIISTEEVSEITANPYDTALSMAAFPDLSHCEYRQQKHSVSLLIEVGEGGAARMAAAKQGAAKAVDGSEDETLWEPIQGVLTVMSGGRCVEIVVSPEHGDAPVRLEQAKALARLLLERSSMKSTATPVAAPEESAPEPTPAPEVSTPATTAQ